MLDNNELNINSNNNNNIKELLMKPHKCYLNDINIILNSNLNIKIHALCHITGGGLIENPRRVIPDDLNICFPNNKQLDEWENDETRPWKIPELFKIIKNNSNYKNKKWKDMFKTFNCGIGMLVITSEKDSKLIIDLWNTHNIEHLGIIGKIEN